MNCAIWNTPAQLLENAGDFQVFDSSRTGGQYWISGTALGQMPSLTDHAKRLLTTWICEQRHSGVEMPKVQSGILELIKSRQPLPTMTRMTAALQYLGDHIAQLGDFLKLVDSSDPDILKLLAETESKNLQELMQLFQML